MNTEIANAYAAVTPTAAFSDVTINPEVVTKALVAGASVADVRVALGQLIKVAASKRYGNRIPSPADLKAVVDSLGYPALVDLLSYATADDMQKAVAVLAEEIGLTPGSPPTEGPNPASFDDTPLEAPTFGAVDLESDSTPKVIGPRGERAKKLPSAKTGGDTSAPEDPLEVAIASLRAAAAARKGPEVPADLIERVDKAEKNIGALTTSQSEFTKAHDILAKKLDSVTPMLDAIMAALPSGAPLPPRVVAAIAASSGGKDRMLDAVMPFFSPGLEQTCAIPTVISPPSFGKTYMADTIASLYDTSYFHPFKDDIDEVSALVGVVSPRPDGTLLVADGPLTAAIRSASAGVNTLFVGDEVFNATRKTLEWMLSTLSPRVYGGVRCYILQTRQVEEDGTFEILRAPVDKLHVLFMGNLRAAPPEAFASRIQMLRFDFSKEWAADVCLQRLEYFSSGVFARTDSASTNFATRFATLMEATRQKYSTLELARPLCFRFLIAAVQNVCRWNATPTVLHLVEYFYKYLPQQLAVQNAATQDTDEASFKIAGDLIKACLK
jgi:hypothetical protein